jgi:glycosyltransferase involved in cell wall biosynthesis
MYRKKIVAVVVPAYNEQSQISRVVETMPRFVDRVVIVDDCSSDRTSDVVRELQRSNPTVHLLEHSANQGVGGAIATGYEWARDNGVDIAVVMAGDGQMDPSDLPKLLDPVVDDVADYTKGNRLVTGDAFNKIPKVRFFGNAALSLLTKFASGYWRVADSQTGYTAINRRALESIDWQTMYKRYGQPNDLLVKLNVQNMRVKDVPVEPIYGIGEKSGIKVHKVIFTIGWLLVKLFFWRLKEKYVIRDFHPLVLFYALGFLFGVIATLLLLRLLILWWFVDGSVPQVTALACFFAYSLSFQSIVFAMWLDYQDNRHLNPA